MPLFFLQGKNSPGHQRDSQAGAPPFRLKPAANQKPRSKRQRRHPQKLIFPTQRKHPLRKHTQGVFALFIHHQLTLGQNLGQDRHTDKPSVARVLHRHHKGQRIFFIGHKAAEHSIGFLISPHLTGA